MSIIPVILCGGSGTRLWPLSRDSYPKQFLHLLEQQSLFQATVKRLQGITSENPMAVTNDKHRFLVAEQLREIDQEAEILLEPMGRNTAPAIAAAAIRALKNNSSPMLLVLPSDHHIEQVDVFSLAVQTGAQAAEDGKLVTFGVVPTRAETGYGYIHAETKPLYDKDQLVYAVNGFKEKPESQTAEEYLSSGEYFWNSGMFLFRADRYLEELEKFAPEILASCQQAVDQGRDDLDFFRLDKDSFSICPADSIDYAVMEKTDAACVVPLDAGWNDVGAWASLWDISPSDDNDNVICGDVIAHDSTHCHIHSESRLVTTLGVKNLVIVETSDAILVADKDAAQNVKEIVNELKNSQRSEGTIHREVYRPWGKYDSVDTGERFQVKRITVNPGATLSLQKHHHRAEHWVVVTGTAEITCDDEIRILSENQSTFIPLGSVHRLRNPGKIPLELIEIQSGSYLGEDDIERFEDHYGRDKE
ncbi:MAG: mannose-1-phosphate guanylyltransferase/mannose-6-phosphate isomerase [Thiothrix sp.]|nr:MAG: mannose-1-phosphate guanylyltransferase/mannose-6-phosphate isomerase [Thiothrix sp.]